MILRCSRCKADKPEEQFSPRSDTTRGRHYACKACARASMRTHRLKHAKAFLLKDTPSRRRDAGEESPDAPIACVRCRTDKLPDEFRKEPRMIRGRSSWCLACELEGNRMRRRSNREAYNSKTRAFYASDRERSHAYKAKSCYGVTLEEYRILKSTPCAICGSTEKLCIDHDHDTGKVRGSLCFHCNTSIGHMRDDPQRLRAAAAYLELHRAAQTETRTPQKDCA